MFSHSVEPLTKDHPDERPPLHFYWNPSLQISMRKTPSSMTTSLLQPLVLKPFTSHCRVNESLLGTTPFLRPLFLKPFPSHFHVDKSLINEHVSFTTCSETLCITLPCEWVPHWDHTFSKTTFSETSAACFHVNEPLTKVHPSFVWLITIVFLRVVLKEGFYNVNNTGHTLSLFHILPHAQYILKLKTTNQTLKLSMHILLVWSLHQLLVFHTKHFYQLDLPL